MNEFKRVYWTVFALGIIQTSCAIIALIAVIVAMTKSSIETGMIVLIAAAIGLCIQKFVLNRYQRHPAFVQLFKDMRSGVQNIKAKLFG